ncbi:hypothetical protein D9615_009584 [Tricholomella constricta]|uniref:Uncharacterized protein n=1 Tax=Tricholomella constricta TaxID=117010 RepID=A0A8H5GVD3_9AGAR|nr:hypothetical protein D9615_009584 [Tricholomella constricta]
MPVLAPTAPSPNPSSSRQIVSQASNLPDGGSSKAGGSGVLVNKIPVVSLDVEAITDTVAARLATSLLGHVLFLKSQVPLPVMQLSRMPSTNSTARALRQRNELLSSFDTLTSHLNTTFTALSSALAQGPKQAQVQVQVPVPPNTSLSNTNTKRARVYLAIFVGSNTASAKSKVIYAVDGLEIKAIGVRDDLAKRSSSSSERHTGIEDDSDESGGEENGAGEVVDGTAGEGEGEEESEDEEEDDDDVDTDDDEDTETDPTSSPPASRSLSPSPEPEPEPPSHTYTYPSHADEQRALQAAERLLSRTLAAADAEGDGMSTDMAPTQTHVLLRAPRRFVHPAWIPRQNISASLESTLDEFLEESGLRDPTAELGNLKRRKVQKKGKTVEGVWVTCRGGLGTAVWSKAKDGEAVNVGGEDGDDEWDEMIWWSWDGKIVGFSEW